MNGRLQMKAGLIAILWFLGGCDLRDFWGSTFLADDSRNCVENTGANHGCPAGQTCSPTLQICTSAADGGVCAGTGADAGCRPCDAPSDCPSGACRLDESIPDPGGVPAGS